MSKQNRKVVRTERPSRLVAYIRVSTARQVADGASLEAQRAKLEAYAGIYGFEIVGVEVDAGLSASSLDRPGLQAALARLGKDADGLLVIKLDRLTRSTRDLHHLISVYFRGGSGKHARPYHLVAVEDQIDTATASGRLALNILVTVSEWEREAASERTAAVMAHLKATGQYAGGWPPFGFQLDEEGNLVEDPETQEIIARARALRAEGRSIRAIASALPRNPNTGNVYSTSQIARML